MAQYPQRNALVTGYIQPIQANFTSGTVNFKGQTPGNVLTYVVGEGWTGKPPAAGGGALTDVIVNPAPSSARIVTSVAENATPGTIDITYAPYTLPSTASSANNNFILYQSGVSGGNGTLALRDFKELLALGDVSDVTITSPTNSQVLQYNGTQWVNATVALGGGTVTSVTAGTGLSGGTITSTGTISLNANLDNLTDVHILGALTDQVLLYDGTQWVNDYLALTDGTVTSVTAGTGLSGGTITTTGTISLNAGLNDLNDVDLTIGLPFNDSFTLTYDSSDNSWLARQLVLNDMVDISISTPSSGQVLRYNGTRWVNNSLTLGQLTGVTLTSPADGEILRYNGTNWINANLSGVVATDTKLRGASTGTSTRFLKQTVTQRATLPGGPAVVADRLITQPLLDATALTTTGSVSTVRGQGVPVTFQMPLVWEDTNTSQLVGLGDIIYVKGMFDLFSFANTSVYYPPGSTTTTNGSLVDSDSDPALEGAPNYISDGTFPIPFKRPYRYGAMLGRSSLSALMAQNGIAVTQATQTDTSPAAEGQGLVYNTGTGTFVPTDIRLDTNVADSTVSSPSTGQILAYDSTGSWKNKTPVSSSLVLTGPSTNPAVYWKPNIVTQVKNGTGANPITTEHSSVAFQEPAFYVEAPSDQTSFIPYVQYLEDPATFGATLSSSVPGFTPRVGMINFASLFDLMNGQAAMGSTSSDAYDTGVGLVLRTGFTSSDIDNLALTNNDRPIFMSTFPGDSTWKVRNLRMGNNSTQSSMVDVVITTPSNGHLLTYNAGTNKWTNQGPASIYLGHTGQVSSFADFAQSGSFTDGQVFRYNAGLNQWFNSFINLGAGMFDNVVFTSVANNQVILFNSGTSKWVNANVPAVTSITAGTGLSGGTITSTGTVALASVTRTDTEALSGTAADRVPVGITTNATGQITATRYHPMNLPLKSQGDNKWVMTRNVAGADPVVTSWSEPRLSNSFLLDVSSFTAQTGHVLRFGSLWGATFPTLTNSFFPTTGTSPGITTNATTAGQVLQYNGTNYAPVAPSISTSWLTGTPGLTANASAAGQVLRYNGTNYAPTAATLGSAFLGDVTITTPTSGQYLKYNGTAWTNQSYSPNLLQLTSDAYGYNSANVANFGTNANGGNTGINILGDSAVGLELWCGSTDTPYSNIGNNGLYNGVFPVSVNSTQRPIRVNAWVKYTTPALGTTNVFMFVRFATSAATLVSNGTGFARNAIGLSPALFFRQGPTNTTTGAQTLTACLDVVIPSGAFTSGTPTHFAIGLFCQNSLNNNVTIPAISNTTWSLTNATPVTTDGGSRTVPAKEPICYLSLQYEIVS